jgi:3-oxoacid CoA-transferase subunit A
MDKVWSSAEEAVEDIWSGASIGVGGFGLNGIPSALIAALLGGSANRLGVVSNNCGIDGWGLGLLLSAGRIERITASYVGENKEFERQYLSGEIAVELTPQGSLAERLRAGGSGIPAFFTPAGVGTPIADGSVPLRYHPDGSVAQFSDPKEVREFDGSEYVLERAIVTDFALVRASVGDRHGNLVFDKATRNFNPLVAAAGRITIAEVERLVEPGQIRPEDVHTPGIFIQRVVELNPAQVADKRIERRTTART